MTPAIIVDLDGTLCDISHRMDFFHSRQWKEFEKRIPHDEPNHMLGHFIRHISHRGYQVLFVSGRSENTRYDTSEWLLSHFPGFEKFPLFLRGIKDFRPDHEVKQMIYSTQIKPNYDIKLVIDDRQLVVNMWRAQGLTCWQVAEGNY